MANTKVEVFGNTFSGNTAAGFSVISCSRLRPGDLPERNGWLRRGAVPGVRPRQHLHQRRHRPSGEQHGTSHPSFQLAALLASGFQPPGRAGGHVSDVSYDGIWPLGGTGNPYQICAQNNGSGTSPTCTSTSSTPRPPLNQTTRSTSRRSTARSRPSGGSGPGAQVRGWEGAVGAPGRRAGGAGRVWLQSRTR